jgi:hypothetical protein
MASSWFRFVDGLHMPPRELAPETVGRETRSGVGLPDTGSYDASTATGFAPAPSPGRGGILRQAPIAAPSDREEEK